MLSTLAQLAALVDGVPIGDTSLEIRGVAPIQSAAAGEITFLEKPDKVLRLTHCQASAIVVPKGFEVSPFALIQVDHVVEAFEVIARHFAPRHPRTEPSVSDRAAVRSTAKIGERTAVEPFAVIGENVEIGEDCVIGSGVRIHDGCRIGRGTRIFSNAVLYENTVIGEDCVLHACCVIGAYGFGYHSSARGHKLCAQLGNVRIGNNVEVGACSTIDRATYGSTLVDEGTKIDNMVMIGHNCRIGRHNLLCAHTGIAGSTTTGDFVVMAGRVGVRDHVHIGAGTVLGAMAGVMSSIPDNSRFIGVPATPEKEQFRLQIALSRLPDTQKQLKALQRTVEKLQQQIEEEK